MKPSKKSQVSESSRRVKLVAFQFLIYFCLVLFACNNAGKKKISADADSTTHQTQTPVNEQDEQAFAIYDRTYCLKIPATVLKEIFSRGNGNNVNKIFLDFTVVNNRYSASVYSIFDSSGTVVITKKYPADIVTSKTPVNNSNKLIRNAQFITRGQLKRIFGEPTGTNTPIPVAKIVDIYLNPEVNEHPKFPGGKYMYFKFSDSQSLFENNQLQTNGSSNPSPPATPCIVDCDN